MIAHFSYTKFLFSFFFLNTNSQTIVCVCVCVCFQFFNLVKIPFKKIRTKFCFREFCCSSEFSGQNFTFFSNVKIQLIFLSFFEKFQTFDIKKLKKKEKEPG